MLAQYTGELLFFSPLKVFKAAELVNANINDPAWSGLDFITALKTFSASAGFSRYIRPKPNMRAVVLSGV